MAILYDIFMLTAALAVYAVLAVLAARFCALSNDEHDPKVPR